MPNDQRLDYNTQLKNKPALLTAPLDYITQITNKPTIPSLPIDYVTGLTNKPTLLTAPLDYITQIINKPSIPVVPLIFSTNYDFAAQTPGGSLAIGSNTIILNPMPAGITAASIGIHYLYVSGGVGTAEAVLITGWTATTVTVTCANIHSGAWIIKSATAGIQEAAIAAGSGGNIFIPPGIYTLQATATFLAGQRITGGSQAGTIILQNFTSGNAFYQNNTGLPAGGIFENLYFSPANSVVITSGWFISYYGCNGTIKGIRSAGGKNIILVDAMTSGVIDNISIADFTGIGIQVGDTGASGPTITNIQMSTVHTNAIGIIGVNGQMELSNFDLQISGSNTYGILFNPTSPNGFASSQISNGIIDNAHVAICNLGTGVVASLTFSNIYIDSGVGNQAVVLNNITGLKFNVLEIYGFSGTVFICTSCKDIVLNNITFADLLAASNVTVFNNCINLIINSSPIGIISSTGLPDTVNAAIAVYLLGTTDYVIITGNNLGGTTQILNSTSGIHMVFGNNNGIENVIPTIASAASITAPVNPSFKVSGTTIITTINGGFLGVRKHIIALSNITIGGGGNVPLAHVLLANQGLDLVFDGTNWY